MDREKKRSQLVFINGVYKGVLEVPIQKKF